MTDRAIRDGAKLLIVGLAYFAIAYLGLQLASLNPSATPIWPATGLALATTLLWGYRVIPAIFVAAFFVNQLTAGSVFTSFGIAVGNKSRPRLPLILLERGEMAIRHSKHRREL